MLYLSYKKIAEQQINLGAFGYLTPSEFSHLGKITLLISGLSKDTHKMKINWVKIIKPDLGI